MNLKGSRRKLRSWPNPSTIPTFAWREWGNPRSSYQDSLYLGRDSNQASLQRYHYTNHWDFLVLWRGSVISCQSVNVCPLIPSIPSLSLFKLCPGFSFETYDPLWPCHSSGGWSPASHCGGPGQVMWDLWWTKWHWGRFSPGTSVSPANSHSTDYSTIITYHLGLIQ
jgi:hypothetical protein